jgi:hypothetical protein
MALLSQKPRFDFTSVQPTSEFHHTFDKQGLGELDWWMLCELERLRYKRPLDYLVLRNLVVRSDRSCDAPLRAPSGTLRWFIVKTKRYLALRALYAYLMRRAKRGGYRSGNDLRPLRILLALHRWVRTFEFA